MSCDALAEAAGAAWQEADLAWIEYEAALEKAKSAAEAAGWACGGEITVGALGGAAAGAAAGGVGAFPGAGIGAAVGAVACMAGLFGASSVTTDAQAAYDKYELLRDTAMDAGSDFIMCVLRCRMRSSSD